MIYVFVMSHEPLGVVAFSTWAAFERAPLERSRLWAWLVGVWRQCGRPCTKHKLADRSHEYCVTERVKITRDTRRCRNFLAQPTSQGGRPWLDLGGTMDHGLRSPGLQIWERDTNVHVSYAVHVYVRYRCVT